MADYDITGAFKRIEDDLIASMIRNLDRHRAEEDELGIRWPQWQVEQLRALERYKEANKKRFTTFQDINSQIDAMIRQAYTDGSQDQEVGILNAIKRGFRGVKRDPILQASFFRLNERKLESLIKATVSDMQAAETAVLRLSEDKYRSIIFNAQVFANTGAGSYAKAVDMATKDFLKAGLNCVQYKNGARHTLSDYADMAIKTASTRAYLQGEGQRRQEWGISTVIMNKRGNPCPKCLPFVGKVLIDDVWSGGSSEDGDYPLMSDAIAAGLYHPRCKDGHVTYFPEFDDEPDDSFTLEEIAEIEERNREEAKLQYAFRQMELFGRLAQFSLDPENKKEYAERRDEWSKVHFRTGGKSPMEFAESKKPLADFRAVPQDKVVDLLRRESDKWIKLLTEKEKHAIRKYTYNSGDKKPSRFFERLNAMLRGDIPEDERLRDYAEIISEAVRKQRLTHDIVAYRGMSVDPSAGIPVGGLFRPKQFFSTSVVENKALEGEIELVIYVKKGSNGAYIEKLSHFRKQRELLLDKDNLYRVLSRKGNIVELEVI